MRGTLRGWPVVLAAAFAPMLLGVALAPFTGAGDQTNVAFAFLLVALAAATVGGLAAGLAASSVGFLALNFLFIEPTRTLTVSTRSDLGILAGFLIVSLVVSSLVSRIDSHRDRAQREADDARLLFDLNVSLTDETDLRTEMAGLAKLAEDTLGLRSVAVVLSRQHDDVLHSAGVPVALLRLAVARAAGDAVVAAAPLEHGRLLLVAYADGPVSDRTRQLLIAIAARAAAAVERRAAREEREHAAVLQETDRQRAALLASVSHDLRTPLAGIKLSASALESTPDEDRHELVTSIVTEVDRLDRMVRNLLDLNRVERGVLTARVELVPVDDLVGTVLSRMPGLRERALLVDVPDDLPPVLVDFVQVEQALTNLVENAVQHGPREGAISVSASVRAGIVVIRVANAGPGIPSQDRERIFRSFERGRSARPGGSGLGLAIARAFAGASGGTVELAITDGGTAFDLILPTGGAR